MFKSYKEELLSYIAIALSFCYFWMKGFGMGGNFLLSFLALSLVIYTMSVGTFIILITKSADFLENSKKELFKSVKRLGYCSETLVALIALIFLASLADLMNFLSYAVEGDWKSALGLPIVWQWIGTAISFFFGFRALRIFNNANKLYCFLYPITLEKAREGTVYELIKKYPTADEYEKIARQKENESSDPDAQDKSEQPLEEIYSEDELIPEAFDYSRLKLDKPDREEKQRLKPCPYCGTANAEDSESCEFCGAALKDEVI